MSIRTPIEIKYVDETFLTDFEEACFLYMLLPYINIEHKAEDPACARFQGSLLSFLLKYPVPICLENQPPTIEKFIEILGVLQNKEILNQKECNKYVAQLENPKYKKDPRFYDRHFKSEAPYADNDPINFYYLRKIATNQNLFEAFELLFKGNTTPEINQKLGQLLTNSSDENANAGKLIEARILALMKKMLEHVNQEGYTHVDDQNILYNSYHDKYHNGPRLSVGFCLFSVFVIIVNLNMFLPVLSIILEPYSPLPKLAIMGIIAVATLMFDFFVAPPVSRALNSDYEKNMQLYEVTWRFNHIKYHMTRVAHVFDNGIFRSNKDLKQSEYYTTADEGRRAVNRTFLSQYTLGAPTFTKNGDPKDKMFDDSIIVTLINKPSVS